MSHPFFDAGDFDYIVLAGIASPGVCTLSQHDREVKWDVKVAPGQKGATMTRKGAEPIVFTATFELSYDPYVDTADADDFANWDAFQKLIESTTAGAAPKSLDIYHPDLARVGIKSVVQGKIGGMRRNADGGATVSVTFTEYFPPKKAGGSPKAKPAVDPNKDKKDELEKLLAQYNSTPWG
jgi:hypothetical protein